MLPSRRMIPWWFVVVVLSATAVWSVQATTQQPATNSQENQYVEEDYPDEPRSEEATLLKDLQVRLKEVEERERGLQLREEHVRSLQQDLEALAARQAKEAKRLEKEAAGESESENESDE